MQMNRAERRRMEREAQKNEAVINIKAGDIEQMKEEATKKATEVAFMLMLGVPVMVLHDHYGKLMRLEQDGKSREERFSDMCLDLWDSYNKGYLSLEDIQKTLEEECGLTFTKEREKK